MRLELRSADCGYGRTKILGDVNLSVSSGEIVCLLGPNGVGKTTLFKSMLGFLPLLKGNVFLDERDRKSIPDKEWSQKIGYVPQSHEPPFPFSVLDVVVMGRSAHLTGFSSPRKKDYQIAFEKLEQLGISYLTDANYTQISGGERQMVLIARALTQEPDLLIMDEPTANLDYGNQVKVLKAIKRLSETGLGVLMTSHNPDHAFLCSSRAILITKGKEVLSGTVEQVVTEETLQAAYGVTVRITEAVSDQGETVKTCVPMLS